MDKEYQITISDYLYRRFPIKDDERSVHFYKILNGVKIPSSFAFKTKKDEDGLSVNIKSLTYDLKTFLGNSTEYSLVEFSAAIPIKEGFECKHMKTIDNEAHALIIGNTGSIAKKISINCTLIEID